MTLVKFIFLSIYLVILIGLTVDITVKYLRKTVVSKYEVSESSDQLPAISLCYDLNQFLSSPNFTVNLISALSPNLALNITETSILEPTNETSVESYLFADQYCFKVVINVKANVYEMSLPNRQELYFYIHSESDFPKLSHFKQLFDTQLGENLKLLITTISTNEISSRCRGYTEFRIGSRDCCLQDCISQQLDYFPLQFLGFNATEKVLSNKSIPIDIGDRCLSECSTIDCFYVNFEIDTDYSSSDTPATNITNMTLRLLNSQTSEINLSYLFTIEVYIVYIGSIIGAVYGLTVISLCVAALDSVSKKFKLPSNVIKVGATLLVYSICLAGCLYQVYQFSLTYFSYATETETYMGAALGERILPAVSICHDNGNGQKFDFLNMVLINPGGDPMQTLEFSNQSAIVNYTNNFYINKLECIKIRPLETQDVFGIALAYYVAIFKEKKVGLEAILGQADDYPRGFALKQHKLGNQVVTYVPETIKLLPAPFPTDCFDYSSVGFVDQKGCVQSCMLNRSLSEFGNCIIRDQPYFELNKNSYCVDQDKNSMSTSCSEQCPKPDCLKISFRMSYVALENFKVMQLTVITSLSEFKNTAKQSLNLFNYIFCVASAIGFWFTFYMIFPLEELGKSKISPKTMTTILTSLSKIIAAVGASYMCYDSLSSYLSYSTISLTTIQSPDRFRMPAFHIFYFESSEIVNVTAKALFDSIVNVDQFIDRIEYRNPRDFEMIALSGQDLVKNSSQVRMKTLIYFNFKVAKLIFKPLVWYDVRRLSLFSSRAVLELYLNNIAGPLFFVSPSNELNYMHGDSEVIEIEHDYKIMITFRELNVQLLAAPFRTKCQNYPKMQTDCYLDCYSAKMFEKSQKIPMRFTTLSDDQRPRTFDDDTELIKLCRQQCPNPDCTLRTFTYVRQRNDKSMANVTIAASILQTDMTLIPKMSITELIIVLAGVVSLWFGFSLKDVGDKIETLLGGKLSTRKQKTKIKPSTDKLFEKVGTTRVSEDNKLSNPIIDLQAYYDSFGKSTDDLIYGYGFGYTVRTVEMEIVRYDPRNVLNNRRKPSNLSNMENNRKEYNESSFKLPIEIKSLKLVPIAEIFK